MDKFFSDIKKSVSGAVKKSGEVVELTKLKLAIVDTKSELKSKFNELGEMFYKECKGETADLERTEEIVLQIDELKEVLEVQEAKLASLKNQKICSKCDAPSDVNAKFCSCCGERFADDAEDEDFEVVSDSE